MKLYACGPGISARTAGKVIKPSVKPQTALLFSGVMRKESTTHKPTKAQELSRSEMAAQMMGP